MAVTGRSCQLETEVVGCVAVADILNHRANQVEVGGQDAAIHLTAQQITEDAAEVFVPRVGKEGTAVGQHADEQAQQAMVGERFELPLHPVLLIEKPPAAAELHLARRRAVLEVADHRRQDIIHRRIEVVDDRLGQPSLPVEAIEEPGKADRHGPIADRVEARVGAELLEFPGIVVADAPIWNCCVQPFS